MHKQINFLLKPQSGRSNFFRINCMQSVKLLPHLKETDSSPVYTYTRVVWSLFFCQEDIKHATEKVEPFIKRLPSSF